MSLRRVASVTATVTLAVGVLLTVLVATPSIAAFIATSHLADVRSTSAHDVPARSVAPVPTPAAAYDGPLVAPAGASDITRAQLHAAAIEDEDTQNGAIWERQQWLIKQCMARHGFLYDPLTQTTSTQSLTRAQRDAMQVAMYGPQSDAPYDWRTAGCDGLAVHSTGQDNNH